MGVKQWLEKRMMSMFGSSGTSWWFAAGPPKAGVNIDEFNALQLNTVYACVRIISEAISSLPLQLYKHLEGGGKDKARNHPLYNILHSQANDEMTSYTFWETMVSHMLIWGNAYAEIERDGRGRIVSIWPLNPAVTYPYRKADGTIWYNTVANAAGILDFDHPGETKITLPAEKVLHIHGLGWNGRIGYSPIRMARESLSAAKATEDYGSTFFANGGKPGGVLEMEGVLKDKEAVNRLREQWHEIHGGADNAHRIAILENGLKYKPISLPPEDAQFLQTRKLHIAEIARMYRVPLHMLQELDRSTNNNIEHQSIEFVVHTLRPWMVRIEQEIKRKLLLPSEKGRFFAEFYVDGLLRGDIVSRSTALQIQRQNGIINANEWREIENMNPQDGDQGNKYLVNSAMIAVDQIGLEQKGGENIAQGQGNAVNDDAGQHGSGKE